LPRPTTSHGLSTSESVALSLSHSLSVGDNHCLGSAIASLRLGDDNEVDMLELTADHIALDISGLGQSDGATKLHLKDDTWLGESESELVARERDMQELTSTVDHRRHLASAAKTTSCALAKIGTGLSNKTNLRHDYSFMGFSAPV
jgi:hypothetical protein